MIRQRLVVLSLVNVRCNTDSFSQVEVATSALINSMETTPLDSITGLRSMELHYLAPVLYSLMIGPAFVAWRNGLADRAVSRAFHRYPKGYVKVPRTVRHLAGSGNRGSPARGLLR